MSNNELPEATGVPLSVLAIAGVVLLFFVGLIGSVLFRSVEPPQPGEEPDTPAADSNLKEQPNLLSENEGFRVRFETTAGPFVVQVHPEWAPRGATQFKELVEAGFYDDCRFFRVVPNFVVQFGINGTPETQRKWKQPIADDPPITPNLKGTLTFATSGPNSRTTQLFVNLKDNSGSLDRQGFSPFGKVIEGMENVEKINPEYREQPDQSQIESAGNAYLEKSFPRLDYITSARIVE